MNYFVKFILLALLSLGVNVQSSRADIVCNVPGNTPNYDSAVVNKAWEAFNVPHFNQNNLNTVIACTQIIFDNYSELAAQMQLRLEQTSTTEYPKGKANIFSYWALNDVAASYYILGAAYGKLNMTDDSIDAYTSLINEYYFGQVYDPTGNGFFWKPAQVAKNALGYAVLYSAAIRNIKAYNKETVKARLFAELAISLKFTMALKPYNAILVRPAVHLYDDAANQLRAALHNQFSVNYSADKLPNSSFNAARVLKTENRNVFLESTTDNTIYEFDKDGKVLQINTLGDRKINYFTINNNVVVLASSVGTQMYVEFFIRKGDVWVKDNQIDLTAIAQQAFPSGEYGSLTQIALSDRALVVVLGFQKFLIFNNNASVQVDNPWPLVMSGNVHSDESISGLDAYGNYIALGRGSQENPRRGTVDVYKAVAFKPTQLMPVKWTWVLDKKFVDTRGNINSVSLYQAPTGTKKVTLAIGTSAGVDTLFKVANQWSALKHLAIPAPFKAQFEETNVLVRGSTLVADYSIDTTPAWYNGVDSRTHQYFISVYHMNGNLWALQYIIDAKGAYFGGPLVATDTNKVAYRPAFESNTDHKITVITHK